MGFDISGLSSWVSQVDPKIFTKLKSDSATAKDLISGGAVTYGKGDVAIRKMDLDSNFQAGNDNCARNASGDFVLGNVTMEIKRIKDEKNLCLEDLDNTYYTGLTTQSINPSDEKATPEFANYLNELRVKVLAQDYEKLLWQGNKGLTASFGTNYQNYNKIDGIIKQVAVGPVSGTGSFISMTASGSDMVAKFQAAFLNLPVDLRSSQDFVFAIGQDVYQEYVIALINKNIYKDTDDMSVFGTTAKFWVVPGLNGQRKIYGLRRFDNLRLGLAEKGEIDNVKLEYVKDSIFHGWTSDVYFSAGIKVIDVTEVGYSTI